MSNVELADRVKGALLGSAIGAELAFGRIAHPKNFEHIAKPGDLLGVTLAPAGAFRQQAHNEWGAAVTPFVDVGVRAYLAAKGRATPEDIAEVLRDHAGVATPAFAFDGPHSVQELLKEGMPPRLAGLGTAPNGLLAAAMPAEWIAMFSDSSMQRINRNATALAELVGVKKLAHMKRRQAAYGDTE